jgi:hypothetical protein
MPDISMCLNERCPRKAKCYRFRAVPEPKWQSYCEFESVLCGVPCKHFISIDEMAGRPLRKL